MFLITKEPTLCINDPAVLWQRMQKETVPCGLCGNFSRKSIFHGDRYDMGLNTVVCLNCGLVFTDPRPTANEMTTFYREHFRTFYYNLPDPASPEYAKSSIGRASTTRAAWLGDFLLRSRTVIGTPWQPNSFLDIGCGDGAMLETFRRLFPNAKLNGIEPDPKYAAHAAKCAKALVDTSTLDEFAMQNTSKRFDVISLSHVLEHMPDPRSVMKIVSNLLSDQGFLLVQVPNFLSAAWQRGSLQMFHLCHLVHYTERTLSRLLAESGFGIVRIHAADHPTMEPWSLSVSAVKSATVPPTQKQSVDEIEHFIRYHILHCDLKGSCGDFIKNFVCQRFEQILRSRADTKPVCLWGAGKHTLFLLNVLPPAFRAQILFVIDDEPESCRIHGTLPVYLPGETPWNEISTVIVSSDAREDQIAKRVMESKPDYVQAAKIYDGFPKENWFSFKLEENTLIHHLNVKH